MRLFLIVFVVTSAFACHHTSVPQATTPPAVAATDLSRVAYRFVLPLLANGEVYSLNYRIPGSLELASDGMGVKDGYSFAAYEGKGDSGLLRIEAFTCAKTPEQALMHVISKVREVERFAAFGQVLTTADGSESYAVYVSSEYGVAGIVLFRTVPGVGGALLNVKQVRTYVGNRTVLDDIAMATAIARSLRVDP